MMKSAKRSAAPEPKAGAARELTARELAVMRTFWDGGPGTAEESRGRLEQTGETLAYPTVANVVRQLHERGYLAQTNAARPFIYDVARSFDDVSGHILGRLLQRLFDGSRERMLVQLLGRRPLTVRERELLREALADHEPQSQSGETPTSKESTPKKSARGRKRT